MSDERFFEPYLLDKLSERGERSSGYNRLLDDEHNLVPSTYGFSNPSGMTLAEFEAAVRRELKNLLNTKTRWPHDPLEGSKSIGWTISAVLGTPPAITLGSFPHASRSVIVCGLPDTTGMLDFTRDPSRLAELIRDAIATFEPRIDRASLRVMVIDDSGKKKAPQNNTTAAPGWHRFQIESRIDAKPVVEERVFWVEKNPTDGETLVR